MREIKRRKKVQKGNRTRRERERQRERGKKKDVKKERERNKERNKVRTKENKKKECLPAKYDLIQVRYEILVPKI